MKWILKSILKYRKKNPFLNTRLSLLCRHKERVKLKSQSLYAERVNQPQYLNMENKKNVACSVSSVQDVNARNEITVCCNLAVDSPHHVSGQTLPICSFRSCRSYTFF